jgi:hypothetical protein
MKPPSSCKGDSEKSLVQLAATPPSISAPGDEGYKSGEEEEEEEDVKERRGWQLRKRKMMHLPVA